MEDDPNLANASPVAPKFAAASLPLSVNGDIAI
jgi:hypothetical protein